jgi:hypothetical protein
MTIKLDLIVVRTKLQKSMELTAKLEGRSLAHYTNDNVEQFKHEAMAELSQLRNTITLLEQRLITLNNRLGRK